MLAISPDATMTNVADAISPVVSRLRGLFRAALRTPRAAIAVKPVPAMAARCSV